MMHNLHVNPLHFTVLIASLELEMLETNHEKEATSQISSDNYIRIIRLVLVLDSLILKTKL